MKKINFSVCFIGRNESAVLQRALDSLKEFKDRGGEICYLDTGSTDNTAQIAKDFGCKVEEVGEKFLLKITKDQEKEINDTFLVEGDAPIVKEGDRMFDFAAARNYCAEKLASNDMILQLDCDEKYTVLDIDKIIDVIDDGADQLEYQFVFSHDANDNPLLEFVQSKAYRKSKMKWVRIIHEVLEPLTKNIKRVYLQPNVMKNEHWQNRETKRDGYLRGLAYDCWVDPKGDRQCHYFGRELMWHGRLKSAIKEFERHLKISWWKPERSQSMIYIGDCYLKLENEEEAVKWYHRAFQEEAGRREPLIKLAEFYFRKKDWQRTVCYCKAALEIPMSGYYANNKFHYTHVPHELLAEAYWCLGRKEDAQREIVRAVKYTPDNGKALHDLRFHFDLPRISVLLPTLGREKGLERCLNSIKNINYPQGKIEIICEEDEPRMGVPKRVNKMFKKSAGELIIYAANDMEFHPDAFISAVFDLGLDKVRRKGLVAFNSGMVLPDEGNICEHFMIDRGSVEDILKGEIFSEKFNHVGVDNLLWAKMKKNGLAMRSKNAKIIHHHFSRGGEMDEVYELAWKKDVVEQDRKTLEKELKKI